MSISVILADDHKMLVEGLSSLMVSAGMNVLGVAHDRDHLLPMILAEHPEVVVVDIHMPGVSIPQMLAVLREQRIPTAVVVLTSSDGEFADELLAAGVRGYVLKEQAFDELAVAVRTVVQGKSYVSPRVVEQWMFARQLAPGASVLPTLTTRQLDVLRLIASGNTSKRIASILGIHIKTVDSHRRVLRDKLAARSTPELIRIAKEQRLI